MRIRKFLNAGSFAGVSSNTIKSNKALLLGESSTLAKMVLTGIATSHYGPRNPAPEFSSLTTAQEFLPLESLNYSVGQSTPFEHGYDPNLPKPEVASTSHSISDSFLAQGNKLLDVKYDAVTKKAMNKAKLKAKAPKIAQMAGAAADIIGGFIPDRPEYSGDYGDFTLTLDQGYDAAANELMLSGTAWGQIAGGAMKVGALVNKGIGLISGGTDAMTKTDAVLGSSFLGLTPIGLINGFGGKRADTFTKDTETFNMSMGSYAGSEALADSAAHKSGKKYGLFSSGARRRANAEMARARVLQDKISGIVHEAQDLRDIAANMSLLNTNNYTYTIGGLYDDPYAMRAAKSGMKLELAREWLKKKPESENKPEPIPDETPSNEPVETSEEIPLKTKKHENGGIIEQAIEPTYISIFSMDISSFKKGGSINVIPDGALHAHKHHMEDADNLTKKGIPVVDMNGELQAEVERGEITFRLEVTLKLEELLKIFYSDDSSNKEKEEAALEAGKLLTEEIIHNTDDKTKELL